MLNIKQIQYFAACAKTGSFSQAAELLFTTQSNVSKVIRSMEDDMRTQLFLRHTKGIELTPEGERAYIHVQKILENMDELEIQKEPPAKSSLCVCFHPSSWFADVFVKYYEAHKEADLHYQVYAADTHEIVKRVKSRQDEMGFAYVMQNQLAVFQYFLSRNYLEFETLTETEVNIYTGKNEPESALPGDLDMSGLRLIQRFLDEFSPDNYRNLVEENGHSAVEAETVVVTNSDYIVERLLGSGELCNISGADLSGRDPGYSAVKYTFPGEGQRLVYGCIHRRGEEISDQGKDFLKFMKSRFFSVKESK